MPLKHLYRLPGEHYTAKSEKYSSADPKRCHRIGPLDNAHSRKPKASGCQKIATGQGCESLERATSPPKGSCHFMRQRIQPPMLLRYNNTDLLPFLRSIVPTSRGIVKRGPGRRRREEADRQCAIHVTRETACAGQDSPPHSRSSRRSCASLTDGGESWFRCALSPIPNLYCHDLQKAPHRKPGRRNAWSAHARRHPGPLPPHGA